MANITRANGTLTLVGDWKEEDIALFQPVLNSWSFYGQYGIQYCGNLSEQNKSASFFGCGRWGFSGTLESFHEWTIDWIKTQGPLTEQEYQDFLKNMHKKDLKIEMSYEDDGDEFFVEETGFFVSDGEELIYHTSTSAPIETPWEDYGKECFDAAVEFFRSFTVDADDLKLKKWVKQWIRPSHCFLDYEPGEDVYEFLENNSFMMEDAFFYDEILFDALKQNIKLKEDERLEEMYRFMEETYGIDYTLELPEDFDRSELAENESDEEFIRWYEQLEEKMKAK